MVKHIDHVTLAVRDLEAAKSFFALLGLKEAISVVISGEKFSSYMGIAGMEAEHVTLVLEGCSPRMEIQLLKIRHPKPFVPSNMGDLCRIGFNHICFAVDDIEGVLRKLTDSGVRQRNEIMDFHDRRLVFVSGPEEVTVELSEWH